MIYLLPHIIEHSASRFPDKEAFRFDEKGISYAALQAKMNQVARTLAANGVKRGDRVGIYLHKSLESAVAVFGIMQAGAAYVPLDPLMPVSRLAFILEDCGIQALISHQSKAERITEAVATRPLSLNCVIGASDIDGVAACLGWDEVNRASPEPFLAGTMEQDMAYIMYTSGSTGEPKGIIHTHQSGLTYAKMAAAEYRLTADDRLSNFPPLHFDQSIFDFYAGPLVGATTVIIPEEYMKFPASLSELIEDERLTIWYSVPYALIQLLLHGVLEERNLSSLRWVLYGGEPFPPKHMRELQLAWPHATFSNVYGPAEVNQCTAYPIPPVAENDETPIPIGPIWLNSHGLVVDGADRPVEPGEIGELLVRTPTMMAGYWNRPDLNRKAFYFAPKDGGVKQRYYRTGDLVQTLASGDLLFIGRKDRQIKLRGYRVELDEIEAALVSHPAVAEAAAYTVEKSADDKMIQAAIILKTTAPPKIELNQFRQHLQTKLPKYAIPESFVIFKAFPRTGSGKIDRRKLQANASSNLIA